MSARITRSKDELARIVALLESDEHDTAEQLAYAVLKEAADILSERHLFVLWTRRYPDVGWGPYYTEAQAKQAWLGGVSQALGAEGGGIIPIAPWHNVTLEVGIDRPTDPCVCGHPRWAHTTEGKRRYCGNRRDACRCAGFVKP